MSKYIINLKSGVDCASPYVNKYNVNFDTIRFCIDDNSDFSSCSFAVVVSAFDNVCMISEDSEKLVRITEDEKLYLDWTVGTEITSADGVIIYQVVAYKPNDKGSVDSIWYSPEGRIFVGDSIDATDYEVSQVGAQPGILMQILSNIAYCKEKTDLNRESIDSACEIITSHGVMIEDNEKRIEKNENDIKSMDSRVSDISLRLSVEEELTQKNTQEIANNSQKSDENAENISLVDSQVNLIKQDVAGIGNSVRLINKDIESLQYDIAVVQKDMTDCQEDIEKNKEDIVICTKKEEDLEEQLAQVQSVCEATNDAVNSHISDISNPHSVTASQVGLGNVDNTSDADKPLSNAVKNEFKKVSDRIDSLGDSLFHTKDAKLDYHKERDITFPNVGYIIDNTGNLVNRGDMNVSDYIDLKDVGRIYKYGPSALLPIYPYCFYDENYNLVKYFPKHTPEQFQTINGHTTAVEYPILEGARYIRITHESVITSLRYKIVPNTTTYKIDGAFCDKFSQFLFHTQDSIVNLGDSIFGNNNSITSISNLIAYNMGNTVYNCAFGGTRMVARGSTDTGYDKFDFSTLINSIVSGDFSEQENAINSYSLPSLYRDRLNTLKAVDFNKVKIITLNHGTNDYTSSITPSSFKEKYKETVGKLQTAFPNINVVLITPTWRCWLNNDGSFKEDGTTRLYSNYTLYDYVDAVKDVSKEMNVSLIDLYNIGINKYNWSNFFSESDTTHQNENGRRKIADVISRSLILTA